MSNALEQASLIMVPSGYEDGRLGSLKPLDGSGDFTFARCNGAAQCDLAATRVNADGYIEKGYENLLLQSNSFTTSPWTSNTNETSGQAGYDGSNDAWKLSAISGTSSRIIQTFSISGVITISIYAKSAEWDYVGLYIAGSNKGVVWSLIDGTPQNPIGFGYPDIYGNGESIGNGWWRFSITHNAIAGEYRIYPCEQNIYNGNNPDGVKGIYIQDAMLNQGMVAYPYVETTTAPVAGGILEDMPRLDYHDPDSPNPKSCPSLLLEPERTNLITHSEYLNGISGLSKIGSSFDTNVTTSPEGLDNASLLKEDSSNGSHFAYKDFALTNGSTYTISIFAKAGGVNRNLLFGDGGVGWGSGFNGQFDLTAGTATGGTIEPMGSGWYRCSVTGTTNATSSRLIVYSTLNTATSYQGDGTSGVYLYGFQFEQGSYPTSYIPTYGVSQTRLRDNTNNLSSPAIAGATEWTFVFDSTGAILTGNRVIFRVNTTTAYFAYFTSYDGKLYNSLTGFFGNAYTGKICVKYDGVNLHSFVNGVKLLSKETIGLGTTTSLGNITSDVSYVPLHQMLFFKTALSDEECIALTTIS